MWIARWTFVAIVMLLVIGVSLQNSTSVDLRFIKWTWFNVPLFLVIYFSFAAGLVVFLFVAVWKQFQQSIELAKANREIRKLQKQLAEQKPQIQAGDKADESEDDEEKTEEKES